MTRSVRAAFFASLACILGAFVPSERPSPADAVTAPVVAASPVPSEAHPSPDVARARSLDFPADRSAGSPFSSSQAIPFATAPAAAAMATTATPAFTASARIDRLPPCRAPPALS